MNAYIKTLRPNHWIKNLLIFTPLFFSHNFLEPSLFWLNTMLFFSFSLTASAVYCVNDLFDYEKDRMHPEKSKRPLAAGLINQRAVKILALVTLLMALAILIVINASINVYIVLFSYFTMNLLYTKWLKQIPLVDIFILAIGFVLRVILGGVGCEIELSHWIIILTFMLALFLAITKRLNDVQIKQDLTLDLRQASSSYTVEFLQVLLSISGAVSIVTYIMYTLSDDVIQRLNSDKIYLSVIFVLLVLFEFLHVALIKKESGNPTDVFYKNRKIQFSLLGWLIFFFFTIYK